MATVPPRHKFLVLRHKRPETSNQVTRRKTKNTKKYPGKKTNTCYTTIKSSIPQKLSESFSYIVIYTQIKFTAILNITHHTQK